jgi:transcription antitermination factor NusG
MTAVGVGARLLTSHWSVGLLVPGKEFMCHIDMERLGVESYLPLGTKLTKPKRKHKAVRAIFFPFPGYIFVKNIHGHFLEMRNVRGFRRVVFDKIHDHIVEDVKAKQRRGTFDIDNFAKCRVTLCKGDMVQFLMGPLVGHFGVVDRDTHGSNWVSVDVLGRRIKIFVDFIQKIEEKRNDLVG